MKRLQNLLAALQQKPTLDLLDVLEVLIVVREYYILESLKWQCTCSIKTKFDMQQDVELCEILINTTNKEIRDQKHYPVSKEWLTSIVNLCKKKTHDYSELQAA